MNRIKIFLRLIRIKHYIKNLVCFVPLIFSLNFTNYKLCAKTGLVFIIFCLISSAIYIFNDLFDLKDDKTNKKKRPITEGKVSLPFAFAIMLIFLISGLFVCAKINIFTLLAATFYIVLNIFYTIYLKKIEIIDAVCIAFGFILRILAGCGAIMVLPSPLVILLTFFISMFFTFSKRRLEFCKKEAKQRKSVEKFNLELLNQFVCANAVLSIAFYFAYVMDTATMERAQTDFLYISAIPFTIIILRLLLLVNTQNQTQDPADFIYKDKPVQLFFIIYFITLGLILII